MNNEKKLKTYLSLKSDLESAIWDYAKEYFEVKEEYSFQFFSEITHIGVSEICFEGDEYWRYGGHERHHGSMPTEFIYSDECRSKITSEILEEKRKALEDGLERERKKIEEAQANELRIFEELKAKFEK